MTPFTRLDWSAVHLLGLALCALALLPLLGGPVLPSAGGDIVSYFYPAGLIVKRAVEAGEVPFWNPHQLSGAPFQADVATAVFYPPGYLLHRLLDVTGALRAYLCLHLLLACLGACFYLRCLGLGPFAAGYGAFAYSLGGYLHHRLNAVPLLGFAAWIPLLFGLVEKALGAGRNRGLWALGLALGVASQVLVGFPQGSYYTLAALGAYAATVALRPEAWRSPRRLAASVRRLAVAVLLPCGAALGIAAVQLLPFLEFLRHSGLSGGYPRGEPYGGMVGADLVALLGVFGGSEVTSLHAGALVPALAVLAVVASRGRRTWFFAVLFLASLALAAQAQNPVRWAAEHLVPGWSRVAGHMQERVLVLGVFALAVLGALAMEEIGQQRRRLACLVGAELVALLALRALAPVLAPGLAEPMESRPVSLVLVCLGAGFAILLVAPRLRLGPRALAASLLLLLALDLRLHQRAQGLPTFSPEETFAASAAARFLKERMGKDERLASVRPQVIHLGYYDVPGAARFLVANAASVYELDDALGYNPLQLGRYRSLLAAINAPRGYDYHVGVALGLRTPLGRLLGVRYLVTDSDPRSLEPQRPLLWSGELVLDRGAGEAWVRAARGRGPLAGLEVHGTLANAPQVEQAAPVALVEVTAADGSRSEHVLRAGIDLGEWAWDRADVRPVVRHERPPIAASWRTREGFEGHTYRADVCFESPRRLAALRLELLDPGLTWTLHAIRGFEPAGAEAPVFAGGEVRIHAIEDALPRAFLVHRAEHLEGEAAILRRLRDADFDPLGNVVLEGGPDAREAALGAPLVARGAWADPRAWPPEPGEERGDRVRTIRRTANALRFEVRSARPGVLVVLDTYYPAWRARVDGLPARLHRANLAFRGVAVPAGVHTVDIRYDPGRFRVGAAVSALTLAVLGAVAVVGRRRPAAGGREGRE